MAILNRVSSQNFGQTIDIAKKIGANLRGGEFIELVGDVGSGKTTFVKGLLEGAKSKDHVSSPTFTISKVYEAPRFDVVHFDFYRLNQAGLVAFELQEAIEQSSNVIVVEWSNVVKNVLPKERLTIKIIPQNDETRTLEINCNKSLQYLIQDL